MATRTTNARIPSPQVGDAGPAYANTLIAALDAIDALGPIGKLAVSAVESPSTSLNVKVAAGSFRKADGTIVTYAGSASFSLTASATNSVYLTDAGTLTKATTGYPAATNLVRLATVATGATTVGTITDDRAPFSSFGGTSAAGAPIDGTYITQTNNGTLTNEQALGSLATGILKSTTTTGVLSIAVAGNDYLSPSGSGALLTALNATQLATGAVGTARLGMGTASATTYLRGDQTWATIAGAGDASTNTAISVDSEVALFSSTTGKLLKRAAITGVAKLTAGVLSAATVGTDYLSPSGSGAALTALNATQLATGTVATVRLGTGTASATTYLRGDQTWQTIAGSGDASTNTISSVDSEVVLFSGTAGKTLKRASGTGIAKLMSGVLTTATAGTDYLAPGGAISGTTCDLSNDLSMNVGADIILSAGSHIYISTVAPGSMIGNLSVSLMGFWGTTPSVQPTAVANATDATSVIAQLNALLAKLRTIGLIAP